MKKVILKDLAPIFGLVIRSANAYNRDMNGSASIIPKVRWFLTAVVVAALSAATLSGQVPVTDNDAVEPLTALMRQWLWVLGGEAEQFESRAREIAGVVNKPGATPIVLCEQPARTAAVVILVFDPGARGRGSALVSLREGGHPDQLLPGEKPEPLSEVGGDSGIFIGSAAVEGSHGTKVQAMYMRSTSGDGASVTLASRIVIMAFH